MRLKQFINEGRRSKEISFDEAVKIASKHCKKAISSSTPIYRGINDNNIYQYSFIDPKKYTRRSVETQNIYTYIIDNSPAWKEYPKRSKSIICTTKRTEATTYGFIYLVFPFDGSKIGVSPEADIWYAFKEINKKDGSLLSFNDRIMMIFDELGLTFYDGTYEKFLNSMKILQDNIHRSKLVRFSVLQNYKSGDIIKFIEDILDPKKNGFQLKTIGDALPFDKEVWTDGKSVIVHEDNVDNFIETVKNNL